MKINVRLDNVSLMNESIYDINKVPLTVVSLT